MAAAPQDRQSMGYLQADKPVPFQFPMDHGPHLDYQTEWWYYTGNLVSNQGEPFGYQFTIFRRALLPPLERTTRESVWAADQVYMAHLALTDVQAQSFQAIERFSRGAAGLAGAQAEPYQVWLEDWQIEELAPGLIRMRAGQDGLALDLVLTDAKGPILHGDRGYSRKGPQPGNASYYYSLTRLETSGSIQVDGVEHAVTGLSWMDHEWSTSGLADGQVGWDWFSIQLNDGSEMMLFQLRREDGTIDPSSSGTFIEPDGTAHHLNADEVDVQVNQTWRSPHTGANYPASWSITAPRLDLVLQIEPYLADQELNVSYAYWEGAVAVEGRRASQEVSGRGYVELTGYAGSMQGQF
jgi:predicted secreted hydrolase